MKSLKEIYCNLYMGDLRMKKVSTLVALSLALLSVSNAYAQFIIQKELVFDQLSKRWTEYQQKETSSLLDFNRNYYTDTVSVKEMKEAFLKYKDIKFTSSPYEGLDSVKRMGSIGTGVIPLSPLRNHRNQEVRGSRGVWDWLGTLGLSSLLNKSGVPQEALRKKIKDEDIETCLNGEVYILREPRWYMGFIVSPECELEIYQNGKIVGRSLKVHYSDFFSYASRYSDVWDGQWHSYVDNGARLLGAMLGLNTMRNYWTPERTFSILMYAKTYPRSNKISYDVELLWPNEPDKETEALFLDLKRFVESLPSKSFAPYYTTGMRRMTGRYYKVTVNKCGWLIQDYLDL